MRITGKSAPVAVKEKYMDTKTINSIEQEVNNLQEEIVNLRRMIHQNPELSFAEKQTSALIYDNLKAVPDLEVSRPTATSVIAVLKGHREGKVLALRCDMDALNLQEENRIAYKSQNPGVMHACGHDGHTAMLVGAVKILVKYKSILQGEIRFIFQHAEEWHPGGARDLVGQGVLKGVDIILALHLWVPLEAGKIGLSSGPLMAAPDNFDIIISGQGGHAARPQEVIDPIVVGAQIINALQTIVSRRNDPLDPLVLSITSIHGGSAYNIIPEKVELKGTLRTFTPEKRKSIPAKMEQIIQGICLASGAAYTFDYQPGYEPVINDEGVVQALTDILEKTLGQDAIERVTPVMGGEDFSAYLQHIPGAMVFVGAGNREAGIIHPHHHPCFNIDENSLAVGVKVLVLAGLGLLNGGKKPDD